MSADGFHNICYLFAKKIKNEVSLASMKLLLLIVKILPVTLVRKLVQAFRNPPVSLKIAGEPPVKAGYGKIRPMTAKECRKINYDAAFGNKVNCNYKISALSWGEGGGGRGLASIH